MESDERERRQLVATIVTGLMTSNDYGAKILYSFGHHGSDVGRMDVVQRANLIVDRIIDSSH